MKRPKKWHHKKNCFKHNCTCIVLSEANGIAGVPNGTMAKHHDDSKCNCGRPAI